MKRSLVLVTFLNYALLAFSQTDNPNKPTWWNKYQHLAKHGTSGNGGTSSPLSVGSNVDASNECGPQSETYITINPSHSRSLAKGIKPTMARLTLARKIAAITLTLWKKGENFDVAKLKSQAA